MMNSLKVLAVLCATGRVALFAQVVPPECFHGAEGTAADFVPPLWSEEADVWEDRLLERVRYLARGTDSPFPNIPSHSLKDYWQQDSISVEWGLARLITDDYATNRLEAIVSSDLYKEYSGRAGPILELLARAPDDSRRAEGLHAIRPGKLTPWQSQTVLNFGCDAGWLLQAVLNDSLHQAHSRTIGWAVRAEDILFSSYRLLSRRLRDALRPMVLAAAPDNGQARITWIEEEFNGVDAP